MFTHTFQIQGTIQYYDKWCLAWLPQDLDKYYRSLLPKAWNVKPPMNKPHISIIRKFEEPNRESWGIYNRRSIMVDVVPGINTDDVYYWLDCFSDEIGHIRRCMGLHTFRDDPNYIVYNTYHMTIGNTK